MAVLDASIAKRERPFKKNWLLRYYSEGRYDSVFCCLIKMPIKKNTPGKNTQNAGNAISNHPYLTPLTLV